MLYYILYYYILYIILLYIILYYYILYYTIIYYIILFSSSHLSFPILSSPNTLLLFSPSSPISFRFGREYTLLPSFLFNPLLLFFLSSSPLLFHLQSSHSFYTCRSLHILIYIPDSSRQFDPACFIGVDG